jgi:pilus assembly protein Flp/PilA
LCAIAEQHIRAWYGRCDTHSIAGRLGGPAHKGIAGRLGGTHTRRNEMKQLVNVVGSFWRNEEGQDLLEYALLIALIALVSVVAVTAAGVKVSDIFTAIEGKIPIPS